jgi:hypothetical protein
VARLRAVGCHVDCDPAFDTDRRPAQDEPLGASVAQVADRIRQATTTEEVAEILTELTAPATASSMPPVKSSLLRLNSRKTLAHQLPRTPRDGCATSPRNASPSSAPTWCTRANDLADRHVPQPGRVACTQEVPADERERFAVCACPPPPRAIPVPPPVAAGPGR